MLLYNNNTVIKVSDGEYDCIPVYVLPKSQGMYDYKTVLWTVAALFNTLQIILKRLIFLTDVL